jgi:hypothetical protein
MRAPPPRDRGRPIRLRLARAIAGASCAAAAVIVLAGVQQPDPAEMPVHLTADDGRWLVIEAGPFDLPANASHHDVAQPSPSAILFPRDAFVHGYEIDVVDGRGEQVSPYVLHHVNLIIPHERELFSHIMLRLGAAGPETGRVLLPRMFGYRVSAGDSLLVTSMLHNPESQALAGVRLRIRLRYTPASARIRPLSVRPFYLDVMPPAGKHAYDIPPGRSEQSWEGSPAVNGRILGMGGHLHRHGVLLRLEDVTSGNVIWEGKPQFDDEGRVASMPTKRYFLRFGLPMRADRIYRLTAIYDNPTGAVIPDGGMGALGGVFLPARGSGRPGIDPSHADYVVDWATILNTDHGHAHHGEHGGHAPDHGPHHAPVPGEAEQETQRAGHAHPQH